MDTSGYSAHILRYQSGLEKSHVSKNKGLEDERKIKVVISNISMYILYECLGFRVEEYMVR
jgi:hypothetical protein